MINLINCNKEDFTLVLNNTKQPFYDFTHLNSVGANKVSKFLSTELNEKKFKVIYYPTFLFKGMKKLSSDYQDWKIFI